MHIDELIIRVARGEADEEELRRLQIWRRRSDENEQRYEEISRVLRLAGELEEPIDTAPVSARSVVEDTEDPSPAREPTVESGGSREWSRRSVLFKGAAAAAVLVAALGLGDRWWSEASSPATEHQSVYESDNERGRTVQLRDGILVHLGPSSRLEVDRAGSDPELHLEGRAFFGVPKQDGRRVIVETPGGRLTVLGTRFDVRSQQRDLELLVVDGRVQVNSLDREFEVGRAARSIIREGAVESVVQVEDPLEHLEWMGRAMVFQSTPLTEVVIEIERRYEVDIQILSPEAESRTLTTAFDGEPFDEVMNIVCRALQVKCRVEENGAIITL